MTTPQYEFNETENRTIERLAVGMQWVGTAMFVAGVLYAMLTLLFAIRATMDPIAIVAVIELGLGAAFFLAVGRWTKDGGSSFSAITTTAGNDVGHLMDALGSLQKKYSLLRVILQVYLVVLILVLLVGIGIALFG